MPLSTSTSVRQLSDGNTVGTVLGQSASDPIGFFGLAAGVVQPATVGNVHTVTAGSATTVFVNTTFDGTVGTKAYTVGDIVVALKALGILAT